MPYENLGFKHFNCTWFVDLRMEIPASHKDKFGQKTLASMKHYMFLPHEVVGRFYKTPELFAHLTGGPGEARASASLIACFLA